jgi:cyclic pyranopterin phosphate synthase
MASKKTVGPGPVRMVDVGEKPVTRREAIARGRITMKAATLDAVRRGAVAKGDVLGAARLAGIMAAKQTPALLPLCHPLSVDEVSLDLELSASPPSVEITARVRCTARTGAEMEALTAVAVSALTVYDMCKPLDTSMCLEAIRLVKKSGGKSGTVVLE